MGLSQITVSADEEILKRAQQAAEARGTSVPEFLAGALASLAGAASGELNIEALGPIARRALGFVPELREVTDYRKAVEDALEEKYGRLK